MYHQSPFMSNNQIVAVGRLRSHRRLMWSKTLHGMIGGAKANHPYQAASDAVYRYADRSCNCPPSVYDPAHLDICRLCLPDPRRRQGTRYPLAAVLTLAVAAILSNHLTLLAIAEWGAAHVQSHSSRVLIRQRPSAADWSITACSAPVILWWATKRKIAHLHDAAYRPVS